MLGVSADPVAKQDKFKAKHGLTIALGSDETHEMLEAYGVWAEKSMYGRKYMGILRNTYLIGPDGKVAQVWEKVKVAGPRRGGAGCRQGAVGQRASPRPTGHAPFISDHRHFPVLRSGKINHGGLKSPPMRRPRQTGPDGERRCHLGTDLVSYRADSGRVIGHEAARRRRRAPATRWRMPAAQFRLGPVTFWIVVGSFVIMAGWSLATGTYFAFHDDVLKRLIARQAEQQFAYEDRIAELRAQVDRTASRQLLDQEQFEQKLDQILRRQATLESRATTLTARARSDPDRLDPPRPPRPAARTPRPSSRSSPRRSTTR